MRLSRQFFIISVFMAVLFGATQCHKAPQGMVNLSGQSTLLHSNEFQSRIHFSDSTLHGLHCLAATKSAYEGRSNALIWSDGNAIKPVADSLTHLISTIRYYGLLPENYHYSELQHHLNQQSPDYSRIDALLTDAFFEITHDIAKGRTSHIYFEDDSTTAKMLNIITSAGTLDFYIKSIEPARSGYCQLKAALKNVLDTSSLRLILLKGDIDVRYATTTLVRTIEINLERWRSEAGIKESKHILVNIPAYLLDVVDSNKSILTSRVIVGKRSTPTPVLSSKIDCIIVFPYWYVPRKIAVEEYLPQIKNDVSFLVRNRFDVLNSAGQLVNSDSVNWQLLSRHKFPYVLRQHEGTDNSLGIVKFNFDNPYGVYLHDTNTKQLFNSKTRAFSHGCVRMAMAKELANYLITQQTDIESNDLTLALQAGKRRNFNIHPMPIYMRYLTCEVRNGNLVVYSDVYNLDRVVALALYRNRQVDL